MISYKPGDWFTFILKIHKYETFRQLIPLMIGIMAYSGIIGVIETTSYVNSVKLIELTRSISIIYSILGFTLSLMLVFRTNSAYERWWEGRKLWGELTNSSRSFATHAYAILGKEREAERRTLASLIGAYAYALRYHLKGEKMDRDMLANAFDHPSLEFYVEQFLSAPHQPIAINRALVVYFHELNAQGVITADQFLLFRNELNKLIDVCGACERIKSTPIPYSYSAFLKKFIFFYVMLFPLLYAVHMSYFIIPVTAFILYVLASIELIAEEIEDPFNDSPNDLPTFKMSKNIAMNVRQILLGDHALHF